MLREWHELSPIEQSLARWVHTAGTQSEMEAVAESLSKGESIAVKKGFEGGWVIFSIPDFP